uniref:Uncharacterized protein n=1 Tax=viral metagenome TaxID=1070528 RepID=A0A6C0DCV7_9ZZZZ
MDQVFDQIRDSQPFQYFYSTEIENGVTEIQMDKEFYFELSDITSFNTTDWDGNKFYKMLRSLRFWEISIPIEILQYAFRYRDTVTQLYLLNIGQDISASYYLKEIELIVKSEHLCRDACEIGSLNLLKVAIENNCPIDYKICYTAAEYNSLDCLQYALANGCPLRDANGNSPILIACEKGYLEIVKFLVTTQDFDINESNPNGFTPLFLAAGQGHIEVVKFLLIIPDIDINLWTQGEVTPLSSACENGHLAIVKLLAGLQNIDLNIPDDEERTAFTMACINNHLEIVQFLSTLNGIKISSRDFYLTSLENCIDVIKFLVTLNDRFDMNDNDLVEEGYTAFNLACIHGHLESVQFLVTVRGIDLNKEDYSGCSPFYNACSENNLEVVKFLATVPGIDLNQVDTALNNPFHVACYNGNIEIVRFLISLGDRINFTQLDDENNTALNLACHMCKLEIVKILVTEVPEIDVNFPDDTGLTPFNTACYNGYIEIVKYLVTIPRVDIYRADNDGHTPIDNALKVYEKDAQHNFDIADFLNGIKEII